MQYSIEEINKRIVDNADAFVKECDAIFQDKIVDAAQKILENMAISPIVLVSGPSGSGKTTTAKKIEEELERHGVNTHTISMDNYFRTIDYKTAPRTKDGELDFESPRCVDMDLLNEHFSMLSRGEEIHIPHFMFSRQKRSASQFTPMQLKKNEIAIFEGIHAFNHGLTESHPEAFKLFICASSDIVSNGEVCFKGEWMRLVRRVVRDSKFRGADVLFTLRVWYNVLEGEEKYIFPFAHKATLSIDSTLPYEIAAMKPFALPLFAKIQDGTERIGDMLSIVSAFEKFEEINEDLVQPESLLREFIGGGIYKY